MTEANWFALIAAIALLGWGVTNFLTARGVLPMANAFKVHQGIVEREDNKVHSLAERALRLTNRGAPPAQKAPTDGAQGMGPMADAMRSGTIETSGFIDEQPDSGMEIVDGA